MMLITGQLSSASLTESQEALCAEVYYCLPGILWKGEASVGSHLPVCNGFHPDEGLPVVQATSVVYWI